LGITDLPTAAAPTPLAGGRSAVGHAGRLPAPLIVAASAVSSQCGSAVATRLITQVGAPGALTLRVVLAAAVLLVALRPRGLTPAALRRLPGRDLAVMVAFGLVLAGMNLSFYEAISRVPLGVAVTVEFIGPLAVSVVGSRAWSHVIWALLAAGGVFLLASGDLFGTALPGAEHHLDVAGVGLALVAGACWAGYIVFNKETGRRFWGTSGLAGAMVVAAVVVAPVGAVTTGVALLRPEVLGIGLAVALLSSALPYSFEMAALRRVTPRAFGVLLSMAPGIAALAGLVILGQRLSGVEIAALILVVAANVGSTWHTARVASPAPAGTHASHPDALLPRTSGIARTTASTGGPASSVQ